MTFDRLRRGRLFLAVGFLLFATAVAFGWFYWVPHYRPDLRHGETHGIDVSHHQGEIDWSRVKTDAVQFAYIKATEGADFTDPRYLRNSQGAAQAGLDGGSYHFFTLCKPGSEQAEHFLNAKSQVEDTLPPAVDLELAGNCSARPSPSEVKQEISSFIDLVEGATGERLVLYIGKDFEQRYPAISRFDRPLWERRFLLRPDGDEWMIWQIWGFAHIEGIEGNVDLNVMRTSDLP